MRPVSAETVEWFPVACNGGDLSRSAPAQELCRKETWFGRAGKPCLAPARKLPPRLAEEPGVRLPEAEAMEFAPPALRRTSRMVLFRVRFGNLVRCRSGRWRQRRIAGAGRQ